MNKTVAYIIGAVVVVLIIVLLAMRGGESSDAPEGTPTPGTGDASMSGPQSLRDIYAGGSPRTCAFESENPDGSRSSGVVYVSPGHLRGDFTTGSATAEPVESHMIVEGDTAYIWSGSMPQGVKMSFANMSTQGSQQGGVNAEQKVNYECNSWSGDPDKFELPSGVTFLDVTGGVTVPAAQ